ncbi:hypothetical protein OG705_27685 [Streptomyces sp. NBC_00838]|uniref:hypothetical protein n=1 Tax=Streptomyces sp. NBC_00838 TaxID=2903680 RepID=UPI00386E1D07|nr:hypothetical protein OG705_27685 [Streptomyces sp. NBC_00838]
MALRSARTSKRSGRTPGEAPDTGGRPAESTPVPTVDETLPATTGWLLRGKDGRLTAYAPTEDGVLRWTEERLGGPKWSGPELLPAPGLLPYLSIAGGAQGYVHLVGLRRKPAAGGQIRTDVVYAVQFQTGRPLRDWQALGTPYPKDLARGGLLGLPAAVIDPNGSLHLFARNAGRGLSARIQKPSGAWLTWADLKGSRMTGEAAAVVGEDGLIEVLGPTDDAVMRWRQPKVAAKAERDPKSFAARVTPGTLTSERTGGDRLTHYWRDTDDRTVHAWRLETGETAPLGGPGTGPIALLRTPVDGHDCTILAQRGLDGRPALAAYPTEDESAGVTWTPTGEECVGAPALALDGRGRVVMAVIAKDGGLRVSRQKAEPGLALEAWSRV